MENDIVTKIGIAIGAVLVLYALYVVIKGIF